MGNVVDSFVLEFGLDPAKFTAGQKAVLEGMKKVQEQALRQGKDVEAQGKKLTEFFAGMKREAVGLLAGFFGGRGLERLISHLTSTNAALSRNANLLQISARELSVWQGMAKATGGSADGITSSMKNLYNSINTFLLTGQGDFLGVMNSLGIQLKKVNGEVKTADELFGEFHEKVQGMAPGKAKAFLTTLGIDENTINLLIMTSSEFSKLRDRIVALSPVTKEDADAARELSGAWSETTTAADNFATKIMTKLTPALLGALRAQRDLFSAGAKGAENSGGFWGWLKGMREKTIGLNQDIARSVGKKVDGGSPAPSAVSGSMSEDEVREYIRAAAIKRGIDPDVALKVWESEGKHGVGASKQSTVIKKDGTREESFGPFQLYMGGGLGNVFQKRTGMDPRDPNTFRQQIDFSLDEASKNGWGPWHGWKGTKFAGIGAPGMGGGGGGQGGGNTTKSIHIGSIVVQTQATDAEGIAGSLKPYLEGDNFTASANSGQI